MRVRIFILTPEFVFYFRKKKQSLRSKMTAGNGWESPLLDLSTFHSQSSQAPPDPCPMLILAMRSDAYYNTPSTFFKTGIISASWLPQAGKYALFTDIATRMDSRNGEENGRQGFRGPWAQSCCNHQRVTQHLLVSTCLLK